MHFFGERLGVSLDACASSRLRVKVRAGEGNAPRARLRAPLPPRPGRRRGLGVGGGDVLRGGTRRVSQFNWCPWVHRRALRRR